MPIKNLVREIGDIKKIIHKEYKNFLLFDDSNLLTHTFFQKLINKFNTTV